MVALLGLSECMLVCTHGVDSNMPTHDDAKSGFPRSWKILKFETILESHGKVMDFCLFSRSHGKLIFQGKVMERSWNFTQTVSSVHDVWLWQSCGLHIVHYFRSRSLVYILMSV